MTITDADIVSITTNYFDTVEAYILSLQGHPILGKIIYTVTLGDGRVFKGPLADEDSFISENGKAKITLIQYNMEVVTIKGKIRGVHEN